MMKWMTSSIVCIILMSIITDRSEASRIGTGQSKRAITESSTGSTSYVSEDRSSSYAASAAAAAAGTTVEVTVLDHDHSDDSVWIENTSRGLSKEEKDAVVVAVTTSPGLMATKTTMPTASPPVSSPMINVVSPTLFTPSLPDNYGLPTSTTFPPIPVSAMVPPTLPPTTTATTHPSTRPSLSPTAVSTTRPPTQRPSSRRPTLSPSLAPTPIQQYVFLHVFDIRMQFETTVDNDPSILIVWTDRIRTATEGYLRDGLPYDSLKSIQLYAVDNRRRRLNQEETFRYGGVAVFRGNAPTVEALQLEQRLALSKTASLQDWFRQRHSILDATVLHASFTDDDEEGSVPPSGNDAPPAQPSPSSSSSPKKGELSYLIIAGASGAALVAILLLVMVLCRVCPCCRRRRRRNNFVTSTAVQKFHPNNRTISMGGEDDDMDEDGMISPRRSCMMMQIVDVDEQPHTRPLVLPRRLLSALPLVDNNNNNHNVDDNENSSIDGYSLGNSLDPTTPSPVKQSMSTSNTTIHRQQSQRPPAPSITVPTTMQKGPPKEIVTATDRGRPTNVPSWMNDTESSIHASDHSDVSIWGKIPDSSVDQLLHSNRPNTDHKQETMDEELYLSLQGREVSLLDSAWTSPTRRIVPPPDDASLPFDEDDDVRSASSKDDFDSLASASGTHIANTKSGMVGRRTKNGKDEKTEYCPDQYLCR